MSELTEFLTERKSEATEAEIISHAALEAVEMGLPVDLWDDWFTAYGRTLHVQSLRAIRAACNLGWVVRAAFLPRDARWEADRWSDHPDYRQEWKP